MAGAKSDSTGSLTHFTLDGVAAFEGCVQADNGIGHVHTPGSDLVNIRERSGRRKQSHLPGLPSTKTPLEIRLGLRRSDSAGVSA